MFHQCLLSIMLGIIEGITEFLPISSTAHLRIVEGLTHIDLRDPFWKMYTIVIQLGAVACLPVYFRRRISQFLRTFPKGDRGDLNYFTHPLSLVILAFIVTAGPAYLLKHVIGKNLESLFVMGASLLIGGVVMWVVDVLFNRPRTTRMEDMNFIQAIWIGACQILSAVFPGTSRSMSTIAGAQLVGMSRSSALEFSFFLSIPTMLVATLFELLSTLHPKDPALVPPHIDAQGWIVLGIGMVTSFIVAWIVVAWFMQWVRRHGLVPFAIYRIIVGAAVLLWARSMQIHS